MPTGATNANHAQLHAARCACGAGQKSAAERAWSATAAACAPIAASSASALGALGGGRRGHARAGQLGGQPHGLAARRRGLRAQCSQSAREVCGLSGRRCSLRARVSELTRKPLASPHSAGVRRRLQPRPRRAARAALGRRVGVERAAVRLRAVQHGAKRALSGLKRRAVVAPASGARPHAQHCMPSRPLLLAVC